MSRPVTRARMLAAVEEALRDAEPLAQGAKSKTRARILRAATELFQKNGYRRTSIDDVARQSGVAKGTVYTHFKNKNELLLRAVLEEKRRLSAPFFDLFREKLDPAERLRRYFELTFLAIADAPLSRKLLLGDRELALVLEELAPEQRAQLQHNQGLLGDFLLAGVGSFNRLPRAERELRAKMLQLLLLSSAALMDERAHLGLARETVAHALARLFAAGIGAP